MKKKTLLLLLVFLMLLGALPVFGAEEKPPYYITVNLTQNITTVYGQDDDGKYTIPVKAFTCSVGTSTPEGTFQTSHKYRWRPLFGNVYGQYATRITGSYLFHSVPYFKEDNSTLEYLEYNKLGQPASMGCIRLTVADVKWIYDNCPIGTTVRMYKGTEKEPLVPSKPQKIDVNDERRGWDPTDPDPKNPWTKTTLQEMRMEGENITKDMTTLFHDETYFVTKKDGEFLFDELGIDLTLPTVKATSKTGDTVFGYQKEIYPLAYYAKNGTVYYRLRDIAEATGAELSWNKTEDRIDLTYQRQYTLGKISLFRWFRGEEASTTESVSLAIS